MAVDPLTINMVKRYEDEMVEGLKHSFTGLHEDEIREAVRHCITNQYYNPPASIDNNYSHQRINGTLLDILNYIQKLEPIVTSSGVLFKKHKDEPNPLDKMIQGFLTQRGIYKDEMLKYLKGSELYERYNLYQLLEKLNANATYGVLGKWLAPYHGNMVCLKLH